MESSAGWNFTSNTDNITGSYVNSSGVDSSFAYRIVNSYEGNLSYLPEYGEISQNIECKKDTMVLLSAFVKGDLNSSSRKADNQKKQITINGETIWTDGIGRDEDWQHLEVPINLRAGSNSLAFGLSQTSGKIRPVEVFWDSISLKPLTDVSSVSANGNVEIITPNSNVSESPASKPLEVKLDISPNPCKNATTFTVTSSLPLQAVICQVTPDGFGPESVELKSTDKFNWTGGYVIEHGNHFFVEALCIDVYGNTKPAIDELTVDNSVPDLIVEIDPKTIDTGDLEIKVTPSTALKSKPSVSVSANKTVNVTYLSYSDGTYYYKAKIDSDINEGEHGVSVTGSGLDSVEVKGSSTFVVSHSH